MEPNEKHDVPGATGSEGSTSERIDAVLALLQDAVLPLLELLPATNITKVQNTLKDLENDKNGKINN